MQFQLGEIQLENLIQKILVILRLTPFYGLSTVDRNLVDPASSHMLVSKIKPCMSQYKSLHVETANGSLKQL